MNSSLCVLGTGLTTFDERWVLNTFPPLDVEECEAHSRFGSGFPHRGIDLIAEQGECVQVRPICICPLQTAKANR